MERHYTIDEACEVLCCEKTTVYDLMKTGELDYSRPATCRLIPESAIEKLFTARKHRFILKAIRGSTNGKKTG